MRLEKKIDLYFGKHPMAGKDKRMQQLLADEKEYCVILADSDLPQELHHRFIDELIDRYGSLSEFGKEQESYIRPLVVERESKLGIAPPLQNMNADSLRDSGYKIGAIFFNEKIASEIIAAFEMKGYRIEKKYD